MDVLEAGADVGHRQAGGVEPDDLVVHPVDPGLAFLGQFWLEAGVPITRHGDRQGVIPASTR